MARKPDRQPPSLRTSPQELIQRLGSGGVERALLLGQHQAELDAYFGPDAAEELRQLAREAQVRKARGGPRVLILPGIMGSTIGRVDSLIDDVIWFDPIDIAQGRLTELALATRKRYSAIGVILLSYLKLKLRLVIAGFNVSFHEYDWRHGLEHLGGELKNRLEKEEKAGAVSLVCHSMGGLVARAALKQGARKITRVIMLGTPNYGSFAPVQVLRATYPLVRRVASLDLKTGHTAEQLTRDVFSTFPGLYQLLPNPERYDRPNLLLPESWPKRGLRPREALLADVAPALKKLAPADPDSFTLIAGINRPTALGVKVDGDDFVYDIGLAGDGTVPLALAQMTGVRTWFTEAAHGSIPNDGAVGRAVADLLSRNETAALPTQWSPRRATTTLVTDAVLRASVPAQKREALTEAMVRQVLTEVAAPPEPVSGQAAPADLSEAPTTERGGFDHSLTDVVVGRRRQHRLDLVLAHGDITQVDARAYVLGLFKDVSPSGAARAIDQRMNGAVTEFTQRRMFSGGVGEVFVTPVGRGTLRAESVLFAGLGAFDQFTNDVLQIAAENAMRTFIRTNVEDFATVLVGAGSGMDPRRSLESLLKGFLRGLQDGDRGHRFRAITLCEYDEQRYAELKQEVYRLASTPLCDEFQITIVEERLPASAPPPPRRGPSVPEPLYLIVRTDTANNDSLVLRTALLTTGGKAAVLAGQRVVKRATLDDVLRPLRGPVSDSVLGSVSANLFKEILPHEVREVIADPSLDTRHLVVVHDAEGSRLPWEVLQWTPNGKPVAVATQGGLERRHMAENLSVAKWREQRRFGPTLDMLLIVNPTKDLPFADEEGKRIEELAGKLPSLTLTTLKHDDASRHAVLTAFQSGKYDVVHYAGHAWFDQERPERSGLVCAGEEPLTGADLAMLGNLPALVFFNACESGRVRSPKGKLKLASPVQGSVGVAEALLRGGVANFVGTYWPVGDAAAGAFAQTFYSELLRGEPIGKAVIDGRRKLVEIKSPDWADYIHYGTYGFVVKERF